ncbi:hypothetical protein NCC49_002698 [Naganishia albida]|nr:hypothetical protein NCC49_002698 [Naganishia albida]
MHLSATQLVSALAIASGFASTASAHSIHRRGAQHHHKDLAERMAAQSSSDGDAATFYARALTDAQAGKFRITRRSAVGKPGQKKVIRKRGDGAVCRIRPAVNETASAVESTASSTEWAEETASATVSNVNNWWAEPTPASSSSAAWSSSSSAWVEPTPSSSWSEPSSSSSSKAAAPTGGTTPSTGGGTDINQVTNNILLSIPDSPCGPSDATHEFPNGSEDWINCNMKGSGWTPPHVTVEQLRVGDATALKSQYPACSQDLLDIMSQVSHETSIPAQLLLSIAIRESACNVNARGGGGEVGLMQVAANRCPNGDIGSCHQPYNNIRLGADILREKLASADNNILQALGMYNGWMPGMTFDEAHNSAQCSHNRNRDYVHSIVNGFMQGTDASGWSAWGQNGC